MTRPDFKTQSPQQMAELVGFPPGQDGALSPQARSAIKYYLARALPNEHELADSTARNAAPVDRLIAAYAHDAAQHAWHFNVWPAKPYTGPRRGRGRNWTRRPSTSNAAPTPEPQPTTNQQQEPATMSHPTPTAAADVATAAAALAAALAASQTAAPLDRDAVIALIREHAPQPQAQTVRHVIETTRAGEPLATIEQAHPLLPRIVRLVARRAHVYLAGPAGCGKTHLAEQAATACGLAYYSTGAVASPYALLGYKDAQGQYQRTPFRDAFEHGGLFLFDEIDASDPAALLTVNQALANGHMAFPDGMVTRNPDFVCIAAANTYGHGADRVYVGRNQLDGATLNRFAQLAVDYDADLEERLAVAAVPTEHADQARAWCARVRAMRAEARVSKARIIVSMRAAIEGARDLADGATVADTEHARILAGHDDAMAARLRAAADAAAPVKPTAPAFTLAAE